MQNNPPWADRALKGHWDHVKSVADLKGLPMPVHSKWKFEELGCGHYGCVIPTTDEGIVFKLTSDPTEAEFIQLAQPLGWPAGIVEYYAIVPLDFTFRRRQVFALWREEAYEVGDLDPGHLTRHQQEYNLRIRKEFALRLMQFKDNAARFRDALQRSKDPSGLLEESKRHEQWAWDYVGEDEAYGEDIGYGHYEYRFMDGLRGGQRMAASWRACQYIAEIMGSTDTMYLVGNAFEFYMDNGFLLADVHTGNVGKVRREDYSDGIWVITDPGHVVVL